MARLPELKKWGTVKTRIPCVMRHPLQSRIPPTIGFHRKTTQTRRFKAERGFLRCDRGWNTNSQPTRPRRRSVEGEETTTLARSSVLRVQCRCSALARFWWLNFGDQQDTQSRNRSDEKEDASGTDSHSECWLFGCGWAVPSKTFRHKLSR